MDEVGGEGGEEQLPEVPPCQPPPTPPVDPPADEPSSPSWEEWDVEEAWDLDPFDEESVTDAEPGDGEGGAEQLRIAKVLAVLDGDAQFVAAKQSRAAVAYAEIAARWACPHTEDVTAPDWSSASRAWIHEGPMAGMPLGAVHAGYHGVCEESIAALATVLAARHGAWTTGWATT